MTPIEIIEDAVRAAEQDHKNTNGAEYWGYRQYARTAADVLTDPWIIGNAVQALKDDGFYFTDEELTHMARVVLRSVGGGA